MIENLTICHIKKSSKVNPLALSNNVWSLFETCQRYIYISMAPHIDIVGFSSAQISKGKSAYSILLNILCGLESKIVGETEVFGQFKIFVNNEDIDSPSWFNQFRRIAQYLILDVKEVRNKFLSNMGLRSYGSLTKFHVNKYQHIAIIGGGQLAQKTLPYLDDSTHQICMFLRSIKKANIIPERLRNNIQIYNLAITSPPFPIEALIVAAPIASNEIEVWLERTNSSPSIIVDLRDLTTDTRLDVKNHLVTLDDLFKQIEKTSNLFQSQVENAKTHITSLTQKRFSMRHFRPFGWEDICA